eukprot:jgi/Pico_ML_1/55593/g1259.t1
MDGQRGGLEAACEDGWRRGFRREDGTWRVDHAFATPFLGLINLVIIGVLTRPKERSIYPWLRRWQEEQAAQRVGDLEKLGAKYNPIGKISSVEVHNLLLFNVASATTLLDDLWLVGFLGDWWLIRSSSRSVFFNG